MLICLANLPGIKDLSFSCFSCCFNNFVSKSNLSQALFFSEWSSCNLVRVNSTLSVLLYCLVFVKFCGILNLSQPCA